MAPSQGRCSSRASTDLASASRGRRARPRCAIRRTIRSPSGPITSSRSSTARRRSSRRRARSSTPPAASSMVPSPPRTSSRASAASARRRTTATRSCATTRCANRWLVVMPLFRRGPVRPDQPEVWTASDKAYVSPIGMPGPAGEGRAALPAAGTAAGSADAAGAAGPRPGWPRTGPAGSVFDVLRHQHER